MTATPDTHVRMPERRRGLLARVIFAVPVLGWMLREVVEGDDMALLWFALSLIGVAAIVTITFGLAGLVPLMLGLAAVALTMILFITFG